MVKNYRLTEAESKLADIIWSNEPIPSPDLVKLCEAELNWKKSTTYTMLKKLEIKNLFKNNNGTVVSLLTREEFYAEQSKQIVDEGFDGSFPRFLAAFTRSKKLSSKEISELQKLINDYREE
jgi:BlaI family penicillinase repressor